jgi:hypothetical protein
VVIQSDNKDETSERIRRSLAKAEKDSEGRMKLSKALLNLALKREEFLSKDSRERKKNRNDVRQACDEVRVAIDQVREMGLGETLREKITEAQAQIARALSY